MATTPDEDYYTLAQPCDAIYINATQARAMMKNGKQVGEPKFDVSIGLPLDGPDLAAIKANMVRVAKAKWPGRAIGKEAGKKDDNGNPKLPTFAFPLKSGDELADKEKAKGKDRETARGKVILTARSQFQPTLSIVEGGQIVTLDDTTVKLHASKFYPGVLVGARVSFHAYEGGTGPDGVSARLEMLVSFNKGAKLQGGGKNAADVFKGYAGIVTSEDPTTKAGSAADLDDEIPF